MYVKLLVWIFTLLPLCNDAVCYKLVHLCVNAFKFHDTLLLNRIYVASNSDCDSVNKLMDVIDNGLVYSDSFAYGNTDMFLNK